MPSQRAAAMALIKACYPKFTEIQGAAYTQLLADIPEGVLAQGVKNVIKVSRYVPTVAEIREEASAILKAATKTKAPIPEEEWEKVLKAMAHIGPYRSPKWECDTTAAAVKKIGWMTLCGADMSSLPYLRAQFIQTWNKISDAAKMQRRMDNTLHSQAGLTIVGKLTQTLGAGNKKCLEIGK